MGHLQIQEMDKKQISENLDAFIDELKRLKPASSKGYI